MTRDDIIRMAREAGFRAGHIELYNSDPMPFVAPCSATDCLPEIERFAAIVAAAEREACVLHFRPEMRRMWVNYERAVKILTSIHALLYPPVITDANGQTWKFKSPFSEDQMQELSDRIRAIPDELAALDAANPLTR